MNTARPHARNLRNGRVSESGRIYLITCVTDKRTAVFSHSQRGRLLVNVLMKEHPRAETLAYVIMPDHLHWLIQNQRRRGTGPINVHRERHQQQTNQQKVKP